MPDNEALTFPDFESAKEYIQDELADSVEKSKENENEKTGQEYNEAWLFVNDQETDFTVVVNGLAFWVTLQDDWQKNIEE